MLSQAANVIVAVNALIHVYILILEMFLWDHPKGHKAFNLTPELAKQTKVLAANQGLYNGFLAAGLVWGLAQGNAGIPIQLFFLGCILVAGLYGGWTSSRKILFVQAIPASLGIALRLLSLD